MSAPLILIIEASNELRHALEDTLGQRGYRVRSVTCHDEALECVRTSRFDLVIADQSAGDRRDETYLGRITEECPGVRTIILSSDALDPVEASLGRDPEPRRRYLRKPFALRELTTLTRSMLSESDGPPRRA